MGLLVARWVHERVGLSLAKWMVELADGCVWGVRLEYSYGYTHHNPLTPTTTQ